MKRGIGVAFSLVLLGAAAYAVSRQQLSVVPATGKDASLSLITEPDEGIAPILSAIESASSSVDIVMCEFEDPQIETALADDAAHGIQVLVLLNEG